MGRIKFTEEQILEIKRLYVEEKMGTPSIGREFNVHKAVINRVLRENDVEIDTPGRRDLGGKSAADKRYRSKNKKKLDKYHKEWANENRDKLREYHSEWREDNLEYKESRKIYHYNKMSTDPKYKLGQRTRTAVYTCLKESNVAKYRSTFETLGYTLEELMNHLEPQFTEGMTWDNYGEWHVDHKIPMSSFNFTSTEDHEFHLCWCLDNLQPLWGQENLSKGSKIIKYFPNY